MDFRHQQKVKDAELIVVSENHDGAARFGARDEVGMRDMKDTTVGHVNGEWPERSLMQYIGKLLGGHASILSRRHGFM